MSACAHRLMELAVGEFVGPVGAKHRRRDWPRIQTRSSRRHIASAIGLALLLGAAADAQLRVRFAKIADSETPVPEGTGTFEALSAPVVRGDIAFAGYSQDSGEGIYWSPWPGDLRKIADGRTEIPPGGHGNFVNLPPPELGNGRGAFSGFGPDDWQGIYDFDFRPVISVIADRTTPDPAGNGWLWHFFLCSRDYVNNHTGFSAITSNPAKHGIYLASDRIRLVANVDTPIPFGTGNFQQFRFNVTTSHGRVAFGGFGSGNQAGVYLGDPNRIRLVANERTIIPGTNVTFTHFGDRPSTWDGRVAFHGARIEAGPAGVVHDGIYAEFGPEFYPIANLNTTIPGGVGKFTGFGHIDQGYGPSLSEQGVAFRGEGSGNQVGLYLFLGHLERIIDRQSQKLEPDKTMVDLGIEPQALFGNQLGFWAGFKTQAGEPFFGVYVAYFSWVRDMNCDGEVNFADINPFVLALTSREEYERMYPNCNWLNGDCNDDGDVNFGDINCFVPPPE